MKRLFKIFVSVIVLLVIIIILPVGRINISGFINTRKYEKLDGTEAIVLTVDGLSFRDLNKNGKPDLYKDFRNPLKIELATYCHKCLIGIMHL